MNLYIKQRVFTFRDSYYILDEGQTPIYQVRGEMCTFGARLHLCNMAGQELLYIEQEVLHMMPRYTIYCRDTQVAVVRKNFTLFRHSLTIESGYGSFEIDGELFGMEFTVLYNGQPIASISKEWLSWGDAYRLHIVDSWQDPIFLCALLITVDNCVHRE